MVWLVFVTCILASAFNAGSSLAEREASRKPHKDIRLFSHRLSWLVIRDRKFQLGLLMQGVASVLEIIALSKGSLLFIGPLLTLDLVFLWIFISYRYHLRARPRNWLAVGVIIVGLSLFFVSAQPQAGHADYDLSSWLIMGGSVLALVAAAFIITRLTDSERIHAGALGFATAANYAFDAALVKLVFSEMHNHGLGHLFAIWPLYALLGFALLSIVMTQNTYRAGPISLSQPVIEIVQALGSVLLGIFIFNDVINNAWPNMVGLCVGLVITGLGITILATSQKLFTAK